MRGCRPEETKGEFSQCGLTRALPQTADPLGSRMVQVTCPRLLQPTGRFRRRSQDVSVRRHYALGMKTHIIHTVIATLAMILCAVAATFLPQLWQGMSGRDFRPWGVLMALLILLVAVVLRGCLRWPVSELLASLVCAEVFTLCVIAHFSGFTGLELFDPFNISWLGAMNMFIAVPWLVGLLGGSLFLRVRQKGSHDRAA